MPADWCARRVFIDERHRERLVVNAGPLSQARTKRDQKRRQRTARTTVVGLAKERHSTPGNHASHLEIRERDAADGGK